MRTILKPYVILSIVVFWAVMQSSLLGDRQQIFGVKYLATFTSTQELKALLSSEKFATTRKAIPHRSSEDHNRNFFFLRRLNIFG
jgi:hypothetical protein